MKDPRIIFHVSSELKKFFFSTDHCQPKVHRSYVPITSYVDDRNSVREFWGKELGYKEIPNPIPEFEPKYSFDGVEWIELAYQCPICGLWFVSIEMAQAIGRECCRKAKHIDILV